MIGHTPTKLNDIGACLLEIYPEVWITQFQQALASLRLHNFNRPSPTRHEYKLAEPLVSDSWREQPVGPLPEGTGSADPHFSYQLDEIMIMGQGRPHFPHVPAPLI